MKSWLLVLLGFTAVTAISGGTILIINPDGGVMHLQAPLLSFTPFTSFLLPGLILLLFVGGSSLAAFVQLLSKQASASRFAKIAAVILIGWIIGELLLVRAFSWLQVVCIITGVMIFMLAGFLKSGYESNYLQRKDL